jgi:hypothetical protein
MKLLSPAISSLARLRLWRIEGWRDNPIDAQREVLQDLVTAAQYTEFGRKYNFSKLFNLRAFKQAVPIQEYEDIKPYIQRIMDGEQNVLWNTPVHWFAKSRAVLQAIKANLSRLVMKAWRIVIIKQPGRAHLYTINFNPESDLLTGKGLVYWGKSYGSPD